MVVLFLFSNGLRSGADDEVSFLAVASVLGIVAYRIVGRMARNQTPGYWLSAGTVAVAYCCGLAAYFGSAEGKAIPSLREPEWTTQLKGEGLPGKHRPLGLRQFEKVTVLVERSDLIYVVPTGDTLWIMRDVKDRSFACRISPILCPGNA